MHRIDSSTATPDNRFTEGDPTIPVPATTVTAAWLNAMQEEAIAVLTAAEIAPDKANNAQMLAAINKLITDKMSKIAMSPDGQTCYADDGSLKVFMATPDRAGLVQPDAATILLNDANKIYVPAAKPDGNGVSHPDNITVKVDDSGKLSAEDTLLGTRTTSGDWTIPCTPKKMLHIVMSNTNTGGDGIATLRVLSGSTDGMSSYANAEFWIGADTSISEGFGNIHSLLPNGNSVTIRVTVRQGSVQLRAIQ